MNYELPFMPARPAKPRNSGLTMVIDKGLSMNDALHLTDLAPYIDFVKFGFGTALITPRLEDKLSVYRHAGLTPYFGGTLFEVFIVRNMFDDFCRFIERHRMEFVEVSDGSITMNHDEKCEYIRRLAKYVTVISEVGSKMADVTYSDDEWVKMIKAEKQAGSWKVITEARESGNTGIYQKDGSTNDSLIKAITDNIDGNDIIWEAPHKPQQAYFILKLGANVNLGNIATNEILALEALRVGLRGDTFYCNLPLQPGETPETMAHRHYKQIQQYQYLDFVI